MEMIAIREHPDPPPSTLHIDVDIELFMNTLGAGDLLLKLTEIAIAWQPKELP